MRPQTPTDQSGTFGPDGGIDPRRGSVIVCVGRKGSGKSVYLLVLARAYARTGDVLVLDVAGDDGPVGEDVWEIRGTAEELPTRWPEWGRDGDKPMILRYVPDLGSPTLLQDLDAALGIGLNRPPELGPVLIVVHEMGRVFPSGSTPLPNAQRLLQHGRHGTPTNLAAGGPRAQRIDKLLLQQADVIVPFELQGKDDRDAIAEGIGWDKVAFSAACTKLRRYEHLVYDANIPAPDPGQPDQRLKHMGPLPLSVVESTIRWAEGYRPKKETYADARF